MLIPANHEAIRYCGRVATRSQSVWFDWPATTLDFCVAGSESVSLQMDGGSNYFNVTVGEAHPAVLATERGIGTYLLAEGLNPELPTNISVAKRTEAVSNYPDRQTKPVCLQGVVLDAGGELILLPETGRRVIEFIGNSDTAAYGNLGERTGMAPVDRAVFDDPSVQDATQSWARLAAEAVDSDSHIIAFSGMGAVWNAPGMKRPAMNEHYFRQLVAWDDEWISGPDSVLLPSVDMIVLYIGGNDWWTLADRGDEAFITGYIQFLTRLRQVRPEQPLLILAADAESGSCLVTRDRQRLYSDDMKRLFNEIVRRAEIEDLYLREVVPEPSISVDEDTDWGLMEHWSTQANAKWARGVTPHLAELAAQVTTA